MLNFNLDCLYSIDFYLVVIVYRENLFEIEYEEILLKIMDL